MKKRAFLLIAVLAMAGTLCACERQSTGVMKTTGGKEQTVSEKEKVIDNNVEQIVGNANENIEPQPVRTNKESVEIELTNILDEINTDIQQGTAGTYMNSVRVASHLLNWGVGTSMGTEEIKSQVLAWLSEKGNDEQVAFSQKLSSVYDAYQELLGSNAEELLASAGGDMSGYPWSDSPVETIEAIIDVVQLPENEKNIVEDQPTEEVDEDTVDNEVQEDFSEESEEENPESSLENEDYPGEDVVEITNLQGETRTITAYVGTAVDVIIPRTIGGVPVENISYNAFENTRDYVHSDMETNQKEGDLVLMRCVILPETLKSIEDSAFTNCHDLETVICYAPLETTNKGLFSECQGLKKVVFVNGVLHMDNYLFNFCKNLETVWCKNQVDRIGIQTFGVTPMERLCVNAKNIDMSAFAGMESLKEIHIRGGVEHMSLGAFAMLPSIETICLEGIDPDVMEDDWANLGNSNLTILVPEDTSDEQLEAIGRKFLSSMIITDGAQVKRGTCSMPEDPMPDIAEMLSSYGI